MKRALKVIGYSVGGLLVILLIAVLYIIYGLAPAVPKPENMDALKLERVKQAENFYTVGNCWLRKSKSGLWEEYIEGDPFTRGVIAGKLNKELLYTQEVAFVNQMNKMVPSKFYLRFLGLFTRVFNRHLSENIPDEYKLEIYGESFSGPEEFNYIGQPYDRMLNYHAAHDIGHALQNFALVGCTSFGVWDSRTADSGLLIGRNCDFYMGDEFAKDKIVYFCNPTGGHRFVMITWAGMMGCLSGMNDCGITVTINAAKSDIPTSSADPIALVAREILQYATNIDSAYAIAKRRKTFVSESILIGSAPDHKCALIEKSPAHQALYSSDTNYLLCTNHYQSDTFKADANNVENIARSASFYRYRRTLQLLDSNPVLSYEKAAEILRDQKGINGINIGIGNEKCINELICHHSVIFEPEKLLIWISTGPYQLGPYECYDLKKVFAEAATHVINHELRDTALQIKEDSFLQSTAWSNYQLFRNDKDLIKKAISSKQPVAANENTFATQMETSNPEYWETYFWLGEYFKSRGNKDLALAYYNKALAKEINDLNEVDNIHGRIKELQKK